MNRSVPEVLLVSRPATPHHPDGTTELVGALASTGLMPEAPVRYRLLASWGTQPHTPGGARRVAALPGGRGWRPLTLLALLRSPSSVIRHYFFTPTPRVVAVLRAVARLRPAPSVQTLTSTPDDRVALRPLLFARQVVALSGHTRDRILAEGAPPGSVHLIPPAVPLPPVPDSALRIAIRRRLGLPLDAALVVYLGDYDLEGTAERTAAALGPLLGHPGVAAVFACRPKGEGHREVAASVRSILAALGARPASLRLLGRISYARDLAAAADLAVFPARRLPHKMDLPLALLQSLAAGVPAVVADSGPLADLVRSGAAFGVPVDGPEPLRRAIMHFVNDPGARQALGLAARRHMAGEGSLARMGTAHAALYRSLCGDTP